MRAGGRWAAPVLVALLCGTGTAHADSDALWHLVSDRCVRGEVTDLDPAPCSAVDLDGGWAVLKDLEGVRQYLLIPTAKVTGVESLELIAPGTPNYFAAAWRSRSFTEAAAGGTLPRDWVSLAVNSSVSRSQNQLHIHIDCLRADVHDALARHAAEIGPDWAPFGPLLNGHSYDAMAVEGDDLLVNPFRLRADALADPGYEMGIQTLVVAGAVRDGRPGFVILADRATGEIGDLAGGEQLQDHQACPEPVSIGK